MSTLIFPTSHQLKIANRDYRNYHGFSLLEILAAVALFSIITLGLMKSFSQAWKMETNLVQETRSTLVAKNILETMCAATPQGLLAIGPSWKVNAKERLVFSLDKNASYFIAYNRKEEPEDLLTASEYEKALSKKNISTLAHLKIIPEKNIPFLCQIILTIATPPQSPDKDRKHYQYSLFLSTQSHEVMAL